MAVKSLIAQLPKASWRGIEFPVQGTRTFSFDHDDTKHRVIFRDDQLIESLGRQSPVYSYSIPFREDIAKHWRTLFTVFYARFLEACLDRSAGDLRDPIHGIVRAKCTSFSESLEVTKTDGVDVQVSFVKAPLQTDISPAETASVLRTLQSASNAAGAFDRQVKAVHFEQEQPPEPVQNIFDSISAIGSQVQANRERIRSNLDDVAFRMEKTDAIIRDVKDPKLEPLRRQARRLNLASRRLHETATTPPTPSEVITTVSDIGLIALAASAGMTPAELIAQNPALARNPRVPRGTRVRIKRRPAHPRP